MIFNTVYNNLIGATPNWWLPDGISESQVVGAFQFKGRESLEASLINLKTNITGLTSTNVLFSTEQGALFPVSVNAQLMSSPSFSSHTVKSLFCKIIVHNPEEISTIRLGSFLRVASDQNDESLYARVGTSTISTGFIGFTRYFQSPGSYEKHLHMKTALTVSNGFIGCYFNASANQYALFLNKQKHVLQSLAATENGSVSASGASWNFGNIYNQKTMGGFTLESLALYNKILTDNQVFQLSDAMNSI